MKSYLMGYVRGLQMALIILPPDSLSLNPSQVRIITAGRRMNFPRRLFTTR